MDQADNWRERFAISDEDFARLVAESGDADPLRWSLIHGRISEAEYLQWAMETLQMPAVSPEFFTAPPDFAFWERVKDLAKWNPGHYPLADWQGILLIACIEPPAEFRLRHPHRFVLASARSLAVHWNTLNPSASERVESTPPAVEARPLNSQQQAAPTPSQIAPERAAALPKEPLALSEAEADAPAGIRRDLVETPKASSSKPAAAKATAPVAGALEMPAGFVMSSDLADLEAPPAAAEIEIPAQIENASDLELPNGFAETNIADFNFDFGEELLAPVAEQLKPEAMKNPTQEKAPTASDLVEFSFEEEPVAPAQAKPVIDEEPTRRPPPPVAPVPNTARAATPTPQHPVPAARAATPEPPRATARAAARAEEPQTSAGEKTDMHTSESTSTVTLSQIELRTIDTCINLDDLGAVAMVHTLRIFNGAMVLLYQEGQLKPWKWSDFLTSELNKTIKFVELETPSIFRIVFRTRLPYHGYVAPSATNTQFFHAFHAGTLPAHVTLVPIVSDDELVGMIMGVSNVEISYKESLKQMERLSEDFGNRLRRLRNANAA